MRELQAPGQQWTGAEFVGGARDPCCLHPYTSLSQPHHLIYPRYEGIGKDREQHGERQIEPSGFSVQWKEVRPSGRGPGRGEGTHRDSLRGLREETRRHWTDNATDLQFSLKLTR